MAYSDEVNIGGIPKIPLRELKGAGFEGYGNINIPNAHENIDTLITDNKNKDFFELIKGMIPESNVTENFHPMIGIQKLLQLGTRAMGAPPEETSAFFKGAGQSIFGEPDPVGPQGLPFSQFMQQKKQLDPRVKSIVNQHVNGLFKK